MKKIFLSIISNLISVCALAQSAPKTYEAVELGLSVKWATFNVGATKPEEYGDYFAWGESQPKEVYDWVTYRHAFIKGGKLKSFTKYNLDANLGEIDDMTELKPEDDAASVNWGSDWRMPTMDEFDELRTKCKWTWSELNGVNGYRVEAENGNWIFLPAGGSYYNEEHSFVGYYGYYRTSTLGDKDSTYSYYFGFTSNNVELSEIRRYYGIAVRAVKGE